MQTGTIKQEPHVRTTKRFLLTACACFFLSLAWSAQGLAKISPPLESTWFVKMDQYAAGAHGTLKCEECHTKMMDRNKLHPDPAAKNFLKNDLKRTFDYDACKKCHLSAHERVQKGAHAEALKKEKQEGILSKTGAAPGCGDCHSAHYAKSHKTRIVIGQEMNQTCAACHPDQARSYLANYHGKAAVNLEYDKAAYCTDCHGAHTTVSLKDKDLALKTCRRCHFDAAPEFADIIIHDSTRDIELKSEAKQSGLRVVHWLGSLSLIFVVSLLVFFYAHTGLLMLRKLQEKLRRHK